jgi:hypothetical protein
MYAALQAAGANVRYTEYPGVGHNSWDKAYAEPDLVPWLLNLAPLILNQNADYCTVNVAEFVIPPEFPPIVAVPEPLAVANPPTLGAFAIVATLAEEELQCVVNVISCVVPSLKEPVAVNCCVLPTVTLGVAGVIASETNVPVPTVNVAVPVRPDAVARMVTVPLFLP